MRKTIFRVDEAANYLAISRSKLYSLIASGDVAALKIGRSTRVTLRALEEFVDRMEGESQDVDDWDSLMDS